MGSSGTLLPRVPDLLASHDPFSLLQDWMKEAESTELNDPNAMAIASVDENGMPNVRMVLLKEVDENGLTFYTNLESAKGCELRGQKKAACLLHWKSLGRQVRFRGSVIQVEDAEADAYFAGRPRDSQIGAWASEQSRPLKTPEDLIKRFSHFKALYAERQVPRPAHWSGFRVKPLEIEFWVERQFRLHERLKFSRTSLLSAWECDRLYP